MLNIPEDKIFTLYEYKDVKEEMTYKDILYYIMYDIEKNLKLNLSIDFISRFITAEILDKYIVYLSKFLDPVENGINIVLTTNIYLKYASSHSYNIPNNYDTYESSIILERFIVSFLEIEGVENFYTNSIENVEG